MKTPQTRIIIHVYERRIELSSFEDGTILAERSVNNGEHYYVLHNDKTSGVFYLQENLEDGNIVDIARYGTLTDGLEHLALLH